MKRTLGHRGEELAVRYLRGKGFKILERNHRTPIGEIDIIAEDKGSLVFVEVKTRTNNSHGLPFEAIDNKKIERMRKIALLYLKQRGKESYVRFDVVSIEMKDGHSIINHIPEAF